MKNYKIYIAMDVESPDIEDFARIKGDLYDLHIDDHANIGVMLTREQWHNLKGNLSRFEKRFITDTVTVFPNQVMGFPIKIVSFQEITK